MEDSPDETGTHCFGKRMRVGFRGGEKTYDGAGEVEAELRCPARRRFEKGNPEAFGG
jgi:hypothetical protein